MPVRWTSRKFLLSFSAQITALLVLLWPERGSEITEAAQVITALIVMLVSSLGYVHAEASIDRQHTSSS